MRRIRRAIDLNLKKMVLPEDQFTDPWREYDVVEAVLQETQKEVDEKRQLDGDKWFASFGDEPWYEYEAEKSWFWRGIEDRKPKMPQLTR